MRLLRSTPATVAIALATACSGGREPAAQDAVLTKVRGPERATAPGNPIPDFHVRALAGDAIDPTTTFSPRSFAGRPILFEVWATWCRACVAAMPRLHDVHARYGSRITMLSISLDESPKDVAAFRAGKGHEMPWLHAIAPRDDDQAALFASLLGARAVRVTPLYVLAGADGVIVASSPDLVPSNIPEHLERLLGSSPRD